MINDKFKRALRVVARIMNESHVQYVVIGSSNMAIQGMEVDPGDLDIAVSKDDLGKIDKLFSEHVVSLAEFKESTRGGQYWRLELGIGGFEVEVIGERDDDIYVEKMLAGTTIIVDVNNTKVPCLQLEAEADAYAETNRLQKAETIRKFLRNKK